MGFSSCHVLVNLLPIYLERNHQDHHDTVTFEFRQVGVVIQCNYPRAEETGERQELLSYDPQRCW